MELPSDPLQPGEGASWPGAQGCACDLGQSPTWGQLLPLQSTQVSVSSHTPALATLTWRPSHQLWWQQPDVNPGSKANQSGQG